MNEKKRKKPQVYIRTEEIPEYVRMDLLAIAYDAAAAYFQKPGALEKIESWRKERP